LKDGANRLALRDPRLLRETYNELAVPLQTMLDVRQTRPAPFREIAIAGSNGLMISALARGAVVLHEPKYLDAATNAATLLSTKLWNAQKKTLDRTESRTDALSEDYAMVVQGLLDLFESSSDPKWLDLAIAMQQRQDQLYWDASAGRYATGGSVPVGWRSLLSEREVETPAVNSIAATNLLRLTSLVANETWRTRPAMIFQSFGGRLRNAGALHPQLAAAYESSLAAPSIVVITGDPRKPETQELLRAERDRWQPMRVVLFVPNKAQRERLIRTLPFLAVLPTNFDLPQRREFGSGATPQTTEH
jgi:uncharacterized protein YyaL (SSP411 family)